MAFRAKQQERGIDLVSQIIKAQDSTFATQQAAAEDRSTNKRKGLTTSESLKSKTNEPFVPIMVHGKFDLKGKDKEARGVTLSKKLLANELRMRGQPVAVDKEGAPKEKVLELKKRLQEANDGSSVVDKLTNFDDEIPDAIVVDTRSVA